jgi:hypothetical protein
MTEAGFCHRARVLAIDDQGEGRSKRGQQPMTPDVTHAGNERAVADSRTGEKRSRSVKERAVHEVKQLVLMFLYLFVLFGLFSIHESIILEQHNLDFTRYGFALVNALILAKVMLVAEDLRLGRRFKGSPLIYPVLF